MHNPPQITDYLKNAEYGELWPMPQDKGKVRHLVADYARSHNAFPIDGDALARRETRHKRSEAMAAHPSNGNKA